MKGTPLSLCWTMSTERLHCILCSPFSNRFANNKIVRVYSLVLANYKSNSDVLNHAVVKMLYTIAVKHEMTPMLYQISIFRIFSNILNEPPLPRYKVRQCHFFYNNNYDILL